MRSRRASFGSDRAAGAARVSRSDLPGHSVEVGNAGCRLFRQPACHPHQRHEQDAGAPASNKCHDQPPSRNHCLAPVSHGLVDPESPPGQRFPPIKKVRRVPDMFFGFFRPRHAFLGGGIRVASNNVDCTAPSSVRTNPRNKGFLTASLPARFHPVPTPSNWSRTPARIAGNSSNYSFLQRRFKPLFGSLFGHRVGK